jgi:hypothetical protein
MLLEEKKVVHYRAENMQSILAIVVNILLSQTQITRKQLRFIKIRPTP